ncbi:MAG TPA: type II secretion system protein [Kiritimatiellia bacterium]|nr:type II secretion system protein [Kiritimatiellia bacterium]
MQANPHKRTIAGFTLLELLAVMGIIITLLFMSIRSIGSALEQARMTRCGANLKHLGHALLMYASDHQTSLPAFITNNITWDSVLLPYLQQNTQIFLCPSDRLLASGAQTNAPRTYAANGGQNYLAGKRYPFGDFNGRPPLPLDLLESRSGRTILLGERPGDSAGNRGFVGAFPFCTLDQLPGSVHRRGEGGNYLFADGSVQFLRVAHAALSADTDYWYCEGF